MKERNMSILENVLGLVDRVHAPRVAHAHCDIPCGIYDPHAAQIAALTTVRMCQLIQALPAPEGGSGKEAIDTYAMQMSRYTEVKEQHAEICESELDTLWTDYFKPEHVQQQPDLHDVFWKATKLCATVRQGTSVDNAQQLLGACQQVAEIFWKSKSVKTRRQPSNQGPVGGELVYPVA
jgi:nickel superoxide dismutase